MDNLVGDAILRSIGQVADGYRQRWERTPPAVLGPYPAGADRWVAYVVPEGWLCLEGGTLDLGIVTWGPRWTPAHLATRRAVALQRRRRRRA